MTIDEIKKLKILFKDEIKPLKELLEITSHKVRQTDMSQTLMSSQLGRIKDQISVMNEKLDDHTAKLDAHTAMFDEHSSKLDIHTASLVTIEDTLKSYRDMYVIHNEKSEDLDERVMVIEEHLGLTPGK